MSIWDDPEIRVGGDYVKFENVGDKVVGEITGLTTHTWDDGSKSPKLFIATDDGERTLTASQIGLKIKLGELRPNVGDRIYIEFTQLEKRPGGKTLKHFDVKVKPGVPDPANRPTAKAPEPELESF
jgi:hypothetical protein